ncbi:folate-binding protein YgfZ [Legionella waltersii]|uniref:CAF17-like 4Fe-4S cluster assembly/insertion protein YgfZ n=1 Tax=Legionella waltersii TaxID=66969 RepID=UPI002F9103D7
MTTFKPIDQELELNPKLNYLFDLSYLGIIEVEGDKSREFLQGQLTCDLNLLSNSTALQGAQCNLKGRILSLIDIIDWRGIKMILPLDILESTINSLAKTAVLSRIKLYKNQQVKIFGFYFQNLDDVLPNGIEPGLFDINAYSTMSTEDFCLYHLENGFYYIIITEEQADRMTSSFTTRNQLLGSLTWHSMQLANKHLEIYPDSRGLFLPHRLDLHLTHYINFNKGCYKGQEIIARTHYKASIKHELKLYRIITSEKLYSGQVIYFDDSQREYGELVDFSLVGENNYIIAASCLKEDITSVLFAGHESPICLNSLLSFP